MAFKMKGWNAGAGTGSASPMKQKKYPTGALIPDEEKMREIAAKGKDPKELKTRKVAKKEKKYPTGAKMSTPEQMKEATKGALKPEDAPWMKGKKSPMKQGYNRSKDYYKQGNFMDVEASKKAREAEEAYGPEGKPATVKPKEGRDAYSTAIPQSQIGKKMKEKERQDRFPRAKGESPMKQSGYAVGSKIKKPSAMKQAGFVGARSPDERNFSENQRRASNIRRAGDRTSDYNKAWAKAWEGGPDTRTKYDHDASQKSNQQYINKSTKAWAEGKQEKLGRKLTEEEFNSGKKSISQGRKAY